MTHFFPHGHTYSSKVIPPMVPLSTGTMGAIFFQTTTPRSASSSLCNFKLCKATGICHHTQLHHPCLGSRCRGQFEPAAVAAPWAALSPHSHPAIQHPGSSSDSSPASQQLCSFLSSKCVLFPGSTVFRDYSFPVPQWLGSPFTLATGYLIRLHAPWSQQLGQFFPSE